ncbi:hypothetical protein NMY22_g8863 [Coprinellus aureogranulatus]|nr:hypothetical protein NMY22_g8863 [Coprinellus aureogranulatus]
MQSTMQMPSGDSWPAIAKGYGPESHACYSSGESEVDKAGYSHYSEAASRADFASSSTSSVAAIGGFDTVLAVIGVYQAARHNWDTSNQDDPALRQALVDAAGLIESLVAHSRYLDDNSRQLIDFFLIVWSWKDRELVAPPTSYPSRAADDPSSGSASPASIDLEPTPA